MEQEKFEKIDREKLPLFYRLLLKVPIPSISTSINIPGGIFWAVILPIFLFLDFFLNIYFLIDFNFPINIFLVCVVPVAILLIFVRITINRFIDWWNSGVVGGYTQRELKKVLQEYLALREKKDKNKTVVGE